MTLTRQSADRLRVFQRAMELAMLRISLKDSVRNHEIGRKTGVTDAITQIAELKRELGRRRCTTEQ